MPRVIEMMYDSIVSAPNRSCTWRIVVKTSNVFRAGSRQRCADADSGRRPSSSRMSSSVRAARSRSA